MALTAAFRKTLAASRGGAAFALDAELRLDSGCTVLLGPSGSGKTTLLRCLAGLAKPDDGWIRFGEALWFDSARRLHLPVQRRRVGMVFSDYPLFPRMTVRKNVGYAGASDAQVSAWLERFELSALADRLPAQLSAGQQQRVAIARTLAADPRLLLMDEPFSALDGALSLRIQDFLVPMLKETPLPVLWVTHDLEEAMRLADTLVLMDGGRVIAKGRPRALLDRPGTSRAAEMLGRRNRFSGKSVAPGLIRWGDWELAVPPGPRYATWGIAAENVRLVEGEADGPNRAAALVKAVWPTVQGFGLLAEVRGAGTIALNVPREEGDRLEVAVGRPVTLHLPMPAIYPLDEPESEIPLESVPRDG